MGHRQLFSGAAFQETDRPCFSEFGLELFAFRRKFGSCSGAREKGDNTPSPHPSHSHRKIEEARALGAPPPKARYRGPYVSSKSCQLKR